MKLVKELKNFEEEVDHGDKLHDSQSSVKLVVQNILDQLLLLEKCIDLNALNKLEKLNKLDHLEDLNYLKFIPNLRLELEELTGSFSELNKLKDLEKLDHLKSDLRKLEETIKLATPKLKKLDQLEKLDDIKELKHLDQLQELKALAQLENLDKLSEMSHLEKLEEMKGLDNLKYLESLNQLEHLDLLQKIDKFDALTKKSNFSLLDKLDKLEILKQERSKVWGGIFFKMIMDVTKNLIVAVGIIFSFFYFAEQKEMVELAKSMLSLDAHTINISYQLLEKLSPLTKSKELQTSFYNKSMYEVVNYWNNESFNPHSRLLSLSFISDLNKDLIPESMPHPLKEFEDIQSREMKDLDSLVKALPEATDKQMEAKAYFSQVFLAIHNGDCKGTMNKLKLSFGPQFIGMENKLKAQALYCLFKENKSSISQTLKQL